MNKKISVIMSVYKESETYLRASIESILNQTYSDFEFIIILDNPDELWRANVIKSYKDERIKLFINEKNVGLTESLNRGISYSLGNYIARMDADDISLPNRFFEQIKFMDAEKVDMCGVFTEYISENGSSIVINEEPSNSTSVEKILKYYNCVAHPSWMVKRKVYNKNGGYRNIFTCEDYDFVIRAVLNGFKVANCNKVLLKYRLSADGISRKHICEQEIISKLIRDYYKKGKIIPSDYYEKYHNSKSFKNKLYKYNKFFEYNTKRKKSHRLLIRLKYFIIMGIYISVWPSRIKKKIERKFARW